NQTAGRRQPLLLFRSGGEPEQLAAGPGHSLREGVLLPGPEFRPAAPARRQLGQAVQPGPERFRQSVGDAPFCLSQLGGSAELCETAVQFGGWLAHVMLFYHPFFVIHWLYGKEASFAAAESA